MANFQLSARKKRGRQPDKLSVRLFLLDPEKEVTKVTKETCSKDGIKQLMQDGYGPPKPEHCKGVERVEFSFQLTNEQFKLKLAEIYPHLEDACFVFMTAGRDNRLDELNRGGCCYRCYTPENVYLCERGQGRLYIRKISENEISSCTHGKSRNKRLCPVGVSGLLSKDSVLQSYQPILPKPLPSGSTSTISELDKLVGVSELDKSVTGSVSMATPAVLPGSGIPGIGSNSSTTVALQPLDLSSSSISFSATEPRPQVDPSMLMPSQFRTSTIVSGTETTPASRTSVNTVTRSQLPASAVVPAPRPAIQSSIVEPTRDQESFVVFENSSTPGLHSSGNMVTQSHSPALFSLPGNESTPVVDTSYNIGTQRQLPTSVFVSGNTTTTPSVDSFGNMVTQSQVPLSYSASETESRRPEFCGFGNMTLTQTTNSILNNCYSMLSNMMPQTQMQQHSNSTTTPPGNSFGHGNYNLATRYRLQPSGVPTTAPTGYLSVESMSSVPMETQGQVLSTSPPATLLPTVTMETGRMSSVSPRNFSAGTEIPARIPFSSTSYNVDLQRPLPYSDTFLNDPNRIMSNSIATPGNLSESAVNYHNQSLQQPSPLDVLANATVEHGSIREGQTTNTRDSTTPSLSAQENENLPEPIEFPVDAFLENVQTTKTLEISLSVLNNEDLLKKLKESAINIHTIEIQSTCKLDRVLKSYDLPPILKVLRINDHFLNYEEIFALVRSLNNADCLHELELSRTRFEANSFICFVSVLMNCGDLQKLCLTDNGLTEQELNCLTPAFVSMKHLTALNLSKSNLTGTQANNILQKLGGNNIFTLDLSQNAFQGNEIIIGLCQIQSLEELNLSHNHIKFSPLPDLGQERVNFPVNTTKILLSSNHMMPKDIGLFCSLIRSDLLELNLDFNHIGISVWSLCSLKINHLKVLSLEDTDICGDAVDGLEILLSLVRELEELNLSSNNLMLDDFRHLQSALSNLTHLKKLNLSNIPEVSVVLKEILPSMKYLEELRLSNIHSNGNDCIEIFESLSSLKALKHLDFRDNRIAIEGMENALFLPSKLEEVFFNDIIHGEKLFVAMKPLQFLRKLHLSKMKLRPCHVEAFANMFLSFPLLEELVLANMIVAETGHEKIFTAVKSLKNIRKIDLTGIKIPDYRALADMLSSFQLLEELVLADVKVADTEWRRICIAVKSLKRMRKLNLSGMKIVHDKTLLDMLSSLTFLEEIVFRDVVLENVKQFLSTLESLKCLKYLDLHGTKINRTGAEALAAVLPSLQLLEELVLGYFGFCCDVEIQSRLFAALGSLKYLKKLDLEQICISHENAAEALAVVLPSLQLLEKLVLGIALCSLVDDIRPRLFAALGSLKYLKKLDLTEQTCISGNAAEALAAVLPSLRLLEKLALGEVYIGLDGEGQSRLFTALGSLNYLKKLDLEQTCISGNGAKALAAVLPSLQLLEELVLVVPDDDHSLSRLFTALGSLKYLKKLKCFWIDESATGAEALDAVLPSLQLLEELVLENVKLDCDNESQSRLFDALGSLKYLKNLQLWETKFSQTSVKAFAAVLPSLQLLEYLTLHNIDLSNDSDQHLFTKVGSLRSLRKLTLHRTTVSKTDATTLIAVLPRLLNLEYFSLPWRIKGDETSTLRNELRAAARLVPGLEVYEPFHQERVVQ